MGMAGEVILLLYVGPHLKSWLPLSKSIKFCTNLWTVNSLPISKKVKTFQHSKKLSDNENWKATSAQADKQKLKKDPPDLEFKQKSIKVLIQTTMIIDPFYRIWDTQKFKKISQYNKRNKM